MAKSNPDQPVLVAAKSYTCIYLYYINTTTLNSKKLWKIARGEKKKDFSL